ncbi:MAG: two-component regulator propeller domain-containing protein, partial [Cyclobacteriaceae bacterium]
MRTGMTYIVATIWVIVCCSSFKAVSQSYNFINYGIAEGLVHDKVTDICEDKFGNLWIATLGGGLSSFNGIEFSSLTIKDGLSSNYVRSVLVDKKGRVWAATAEGISMYDGKSIATYMIDEDEENNSVQTLFEDSGGNIWFAAFGGHFGRIDQHTLEIEFLSFPRASFNDNIIAISQDKSGRMWLVSSIQGLISYSSDGFSRLIDNQQLGGYILSVYNHRDTLWLGTNRGIFYFDLNSESPEAVNIPALNNIFIKKIRVLGERDLWLVTSSGIYNYRDGNLREFGESEGFSSADVNTLFSDREGNLWFGTDGEGLYQLAGEAFVRFGTEHGLTGDPVRAITRDHSGNYWIGTYGGGLLRFDGDDFELFDSSSGLSNAYITAAAVDDEGNIWLGTASAGIIIYEDGVFRDIGTDQGFPLQGIRMLFKDRSGRMWIGTGEGLASWDGKEFSVFSTQSGLFDDIIWDISEPEPGRIMVVTRKGFNFIVGGEIVDGFNDDDIFSKRLNTAFEDEGGNYWIGYSGHGIARVDAATRKVDLITDEEGLNSNLIYNLIYDPESHAVIAGTERGVDRLSLNDEMDVTHVKNFEQTEGFEELQTQPQAVFKDGSSIWFGTRHDLFRFQVTKFKPNENEPLLYISGVDLLYTDVDWTEFTDSVRPWHNIPTEPRLTHNDNNITIEFFGNSLRNAHDVRYKFRMVGLNEEWSPPTQANQASFTNLSPGSYRFEVMASNSDGIWTQEPAVFTFSVIPPFWRRTWFYVAGVIYLIVMMTLYNNYRVRSNLNRLLTIEKIRQEELTKVRKRMARDFHDNMGNQIASITMYANLISLKLQNRSEEIDQLLESIEKHTKSLFTGTKDFIWSMDPDSDNLDKVFTYIRDFGEELFENSSIEFLAENNFERSEEIPLPSGWSRQIVLIFKEAMTNALKHSFSTEAHLEMEPKTNGFVIIFRDDGRGIPEKTDSRGYGLKNMQSRAA